MINKITILTFGISITICAHLSAQDIVDNRPISSSVKCDGVVTPQNDPLLFNVTPDPRVVEQASDDEASDKLAREKTRERLLKEANEKGNTQKRIEDQVFLSAVTPVLGRNFKGNPAGATPSDCGYAISNNGYMVAAVNGTVIMYDTTGNTLVSSTLGAFLQIGTTFCFDPRVLYDTKMDRFIACGMTTSSVILMYSTSNDPTKSWNKYTLSISNMGGSSSDGLDYPHVGLTDTELHLGVTLTGGNRFPLMQINNRSGYAGGALKYNTWIGQSSQPTDCVIPVNKGQQNSPSGNVAYFLQPNRSGSSTIYLFKISDTLGASPTLTRTGLSVPAYSPAGYVSQLGSGGTMRTSDCRPMSAVYVDGIIHLVLHVDVSGYYGVRYCRIDVKNGNTVKTSTLQNSSNKINYCFPSVASFATAAGDKTALVAFMVSGSSIYPGIKAAVIDDQMNWSAPITVKDGTESITGGRWGDYSCTSRRHNNSTAPSAWIEAQYGASGVKYEMWIAEITTSGNSNSITVLPGEQTKTKVYPNPAVDLFYLQFPCDKDQIVKIDLLDVQGNVVKALYNAQAIHGINTLSFNKEALPQGVYVIRIQSSKNQTITQEKLVIKGD